MQGFVFDSPPSPLSPQGGGTQLLSMRPSLSGARRWEHASSRHDQ